MANFTAKQKAALLDRLSQGDCIAQCLTDHADDETPPRPESFEVVEAVARLESYIGAFGCLPQELSDLDKAILIDAVEGSTWAATIAHDPAGCRGAIRTLEGAAAVLIAAGVADQITVPVC